MAPMLNAGMIILPVAYAGNLRLSTKTNYQPAGTFGDYEYGDKEANAKFYRSGDYSAEQFITRDSARDPINRFENIGAAAEQRRQVALAAHSSFDSQSTPDDDSLMQITDRHRPGTYGGYEYGDKEHNAKREHTYDYSAEQFISADTARDPINMHANLGPKAEMKRQAALAAQSNFDSQSTPGDDDFMQVDSNHHHHTGSYGGYERGDNEANAKNFDSSDYSAEQFIDADDARAPMNMHANLGPAGEARRQQALMAGSHFDSQNTPSTDDE